jgi:hypothetical protein
MFREFVLRDEAQLDSLLRRALHAEYDQGPPLTTWATLAARLAPTPPIIPQSTNTRPPGLLVIPELLPAG